MHVRVHTHVGVYTDTRTYSHIYSHAYKRHAFYIVQNETSDACAQGSLLTVFFLAHAKHLLSFKSAEATEADHLTAHGTMPRTLYTKSETNDEPVR
jgi:hypothetical protein